MHACTNYIYACLLLPSVPFSLGCSAGGKAGASAVILDLEVPSGKADGLVWLFSRTGSLWKQKLQCQTGVFSLDLFALDRVSPCVFKLDVFWVSITWLYVAAWQLMGWVVVEKRLFWIRFLLNQINASKGSHDLSQNSPLFFFRGYPCLNGTWIW